MYYKWNHKDSNLEVGPSSLPEFEYWGKDLNVKDYNKMINKFKNKPWNFMEEAIKYCKLDCEVLYNILFFNKHIFNTFSVNINKSLTISALAMRIFRTKFMKDNSIYQLLGPIEEDIRKSYTGGAVDVYKPNNTNDELLYYYDVNSLYPTMMKNCYIPIGVPSSFEGNIFKYTKDPFGFFYCKITSPNNLEHPILQRRIKTINGIRTIAGLGSWEGWIFSEELKNALRFGYQFEVIKGYTYEKGDIFSGYVDKMYKLRKQHSKGHPLNMIAKLLMNSLYGKFAQRMERLEVEVFDVSTDELINQCIDKIVEYGETVMDHQQIDNNMFIIRATNPGIINDDDDFYHGVDVNVSISAAITAYA